MKIGLTLPQLGPHVTRDAVRQFCAAAENLGYASLWAQEHLFFALNPQAPYAARPGTPVPAAYQTTFAPTELLSCAAAWTERILLGTGILVGGYHRPVELAQRLATLDHLSGGRLIVGLSVGWSKDEHDQMDVEFTTRGRRLDELISAVLRCWGPDPVEFDGEFFHIPPSIVSPKPLQNPRPPLMSGMRSERGLARTAKLFDLWNPASGTLNTILAQQASINALREESQPPIGVIQRLFPDPPFLASGLAPRSVDDLLSDVRAAQAAGIDHVIIDTSFAPVTSPDGWVDMAEHFAPLLG